MIEIHSQEEYHSLERLQGRLTAFDSGRADLDIDGSGDSGSTTGSPCHEIDGHAPHAIPMSKLLAMTSSTQRSECGRARSVESSLRSDMRQEGLAYMFGFGWFRF